jgi:hypothetical protein
MKTFVRLLQYLAEFFLEWEMFQTKVVEKKTHFMFNYFFGGRGVNELMWKNMVQPDRPQMTIQYGECTLHAG